MTLTFYKDYMELFQGCVLYMDGSSPTQEIIGSHTITNNGSVAVTGTDRFGKTNRALSFNGSSQYLTIPHDATNLVFGTGNFMFSIWFYRSSGTTRNDLLAKIGASIGYTAIGIFHCCGGTNQLCLYMSSNGTAHDIFENALLSSNATNGVWHNIIVYRVGTTFYSMFDGVISIIRTSALGFWDANTNYWCISGNRYDNNYWWNGSIGEVAIWKGTIPDPKQIYALTSKKYLYPILPGKRGVE